MGLLDKMLATGGVVLAGALARSAYRDSQETKRRRSSPLRFDDGLTQRDFIQIAHAVAKRTPRVEDVVVTGMTATLYVRSNTGLSTWTAEIDFNDYGHLTGSYWLETEKAHSIIPAHFANSMRSEIEQRVSRTSAPQQPPPPQWQPRPLQMSPDGRYYWDGQRYIPMPVGFRWDGYRWVTTTAGR